MHRSMIAWLMLLPLALPTILSLPDGGGGGKEDGRKLGRKLACNPRDFLGTLSFNANFWQGMYHIEYSIGTPPVAVKGVVDTGSSLTWTMCNHRRDQTYKRNASSTSRSLSCKSPLCLPSLDTMVPCNETCLFKYFYADGNYLWGTVLSEALTLGQIRVPDVAIGCSTRTNLRWQPGVVGLNRSNLSLIAQLGLTKFSVCLLPPDHGYQSRIIRYSRVFFGSAAEINDDTTGTMTGPVKTVPFVDHPSSKHPFYYVSLKAITVGSTRVLTPFEAAAAADGKGLFVVDTGTDVSTFTMPTYTRLTKAFVQEVKLPAIRSPEIGNGEAFCFSLVGGDPPVPPELPKVVYHLEDNVDLEFPPERFFETQPGKDMICLKIRGFNNNFSVWGNYQMMELYMNYDLENSQLTFFPALCDKL